MKPTQTLKADIELDINGIVYLLTQRIKNTEYINSIAMEKATSSILALIEERVVEAVENYQTEFEQEHIASRVRAARLDELNKLPFDELSDGTFEHIKDRLTELRTSPTLTQKDTDE